MGIKKQGLFDAIAFAARAHEGQLRKDGKTPYVSHVFRVAMTCSQVFGVKDEEVLTAAVLHDTIEDTTTDFDDIERHFGARVARWVALLSKDMRMPDPEREAAYMKQLEDAPLEVKLIKLADLHDNLCDSATAAGLTAKTIQRTQAYLIALAKAPHPLLEGPFQIVHDLMQRLNKL